MVVESLNQVSRLRHFRHFVCRQVKSIATDRQPSGCDAIDGLDPGIASGNHLDLHSQATQVERRFMHYDLAAAREIRFVKFMTDQHPHERRKVSLHFRTLAAGFVISGFID